MTTKHIDVKRLRNLTTGLLHTEIVDVYEDIEFLTGAEGIMTHMLPRAMRSLEPWLRANLFDHERLWDGQYDPTHTGSVELAPLSTDDVSAFWDSYGAQPSPLEGKKVIGVLAP
jgi:hypothetical protein